MAKIKQSIVAQRQIPEHIRENYPLFVEFIKTYYDYLQQTQAQELETIRDVDTTLEEFIDKFKSELAKNFPINLATDKALILKHLREFYLARGSEDSFKFLFRVLFNKEAELFYPSTQILRASDGRWKQDVSIFIDMTNMMSFEMSELVGKFITITTPTKVITTYVENTINYSETIHELFIQRDYANEITVGSIVRGEMEDGTFFESPILQCPTKVKIFKGGAGFKAGDIFALNTQLGRGCLIKITKVDTVGSIKSVQIIKFGLDYVTKFYSYLSSKDLANFEYIHPLKLNTAYNPADPAYNEKAAGFIDYGWASKQTYFYYDTTVPVADATFASDRYFADAGYVGDIQQQFYNDGSQTVMDEDLAIIEVDIGAVAKYPGYYLKSDGFISDEIYIQDGHYYQAFSYVVRVEEELRRYADIVKALIHPSGMKIFSEYSIYNELNLRAGIPSTISVLQLPLFDNPPSTVITGDRGIGYTQYDVVVDEFGETTTTPHPGASPVYSNQGHAAYLSTKILADISKFVIDNVYEKHVDKNIANFTNNATDSNSKFVYKAIGDLLTNYIETVVKGDHKKLIDSTNSTVAINSIVDKALIDFQPIVDAYVNHVSKNVQSIASVGNTLFNHVFKNLIDNQSSSAVIKEFNITKLYSDMLPLSADAKMLYASKVLTSILPTTLSRINSMNYFKNNSDINVIIDTISNSLFKIDTDEQLINDAMRNSLGVNKSDFTDRISEGLQLLKKSIGSTSLYSFDSVSFQDVLDILKVLLLQDVFDINDESYTNYQKTYAEILTLLNVNSFVYDKIISNNVNLSELNIKTNTKLHTEAISVIESPLILFQNKGLNFVEAINNSTNGRIQFNSYDSGGPDGYFDWASGYQPATSIT